MTGNDPSGRGPKELYEMLHQICNQSIEYHFLHLDSNTYLMEQQFNKELLKYGAKLNVHYIGQDSSVDSFISVVVNAVEQSRINTLRR